MNDITAIIDVIEKSWGVNALGCPFGLCNEQFANTKMVEIALKNHFPKEILELIESNPIKFPKYQKFDNGESIGKYFADLVTVK